MTRIDVDSHEVSAFARDVRRTPAILDAEVPFVMERAVEDTILPAARRNTPVGAGTRGRHMRDRWRAGTDRRGVYVRNPDPGAATMEFGGRHPVFGRSARTVWTARGRRRVSVGRGDWTWVYQPPRLMLTRAIRSKTNDLVNVMDRDLGRIFRREGWR